MRDPDTSPNTLDILESNPAHATSIAERLRAMPEVARVLTLQSFVPKDQDAKLAIIDDASFFLRNTLSPDQIDAEPTPAETVVAIEKTAHDLGNAAGDLDSPAAVQARRLAGLLAALAKASPEVRDKAQHALIAPLITTLRQVRSSSRRTVSIGLAAPCGRAGSADGQLGSRVAGRRWKGNATLRRFVGDSQRYPRPSNRSCHQCATIVKAFAQAGIFSVVSITLILFVALRRWTDVALTLVPLRVAIVVTLEICVIIGLQLNFANIIALPLLLGVGVAFKIYYVMAWRSGETNFLQSSLTRAVFFSACTTATAFGSLWFSHHPGTSSMGKLMALSLLTTLAAAVFFQPALMATQR
jgi:hypothetical protein